jgi:hypothetical protein
MLKILYQHLQLLSQTSSSYIIKNCDLYARLPCKHDVKDYKTLNLKNIASSCIPQINVGYLNQNNEKVICHEMQIYFLLK